MKTTFMALLVLVTMMGFVACEKAIFDEQQGEKKPLEGNVIIRTSLYDIVPFEPETRAVQDVADFSSTLQFVVYKGGSKVKGITQKKSEGNYGQIGMTLEPGTYQLMVLAHSSTGNPSVANPTEIKFENSDGYSDTFYYYGDIEVKEEQSTYDVRLQRATSMVRVVILDEIPSSVSKIRLWYEGESGVLNATTGMGGTTNSKQSIMYGVAGYSSPLTLRAYTFLRNNEGMLDMLITAYDKNNNIVAEKELNDIPMKYRMVTEYSGYLFSTPPPADVTASFNLTAETEWELFEEHSF